MSQKYRVIIAVIGILLGLILAWYFYNILIYIFTAGVISLIGQPLVELLSKIRIGKFSISKSISSLITLIIMLGLAVGFVLLVVPMIIHQAQVISRINVDEVVDYFTDIIEKWQKLLLSYNIIDSEETLESILNHQIRSVINITDFSSLVEKIIGATTSVFIGLFSVLFLSFFFLRDKDLLKNGILLFTPDRFHDRVRNILRKTKSLLSRYFIGLLTEVFTMMVLFSIGLSIFGVDNAIFIGFIGGSMHVIPYVGPIIGATIGVFLGISGDMGRGLYDTVLNTALTVILVFSVANLIDNFVLQPMIYSKSVNAHPIEIFIVILMAGSMFGIIGMILAVPAYTMLRIVSKEFLSGFRLIDKLTEKI
jgi:predicted PurR-regulated permease PerM